MRTLRNAGVARVVVVVGYEADSVAASLAGAGVEIVEADRWAAGNGASMAAAEDLVGAEERFVLMCGDHVFADGALDDLVRSAGPAVLVDTAPGPVAWAEGTRVHIRDGQATAFSKELEDPAIDCGVFLLPARVFAAHREAVAGDDYSLAGAVTNLAREAPIRAVALPLGTWWQDVDTPEDLKAARARVRRSLGKETDGLISRKLNRPISTRITMALAPLRVSPHLLSLVTLIVGVWAAWSLSAGRALMGGLLVHAASVLDGSDGETARLQGTSSRRGAALDAFFDRMVDAAIFSGLWLWVWDNPSREFRIMVISIAALGWGVLANSLQEPVSVFEVPRRHEPRLLALFGGRDTRMLVLAIGSLVTLPVLAFAGALLAYGVSAIWRVWLVAGGRPRGSPDGSMVKPVGVASPSALLVGGGPGDRSGEPRRVGAEPKTVLGALAQVGRILLFPAVVVGAFVVILPRLVDLHEVWVVIRSLSWEAGIVLFGLAVLNLVTYWPVVMVSMPGLSFRQAAVVCQSSTSVAMTVPAGGALAVGVSYAMYSSWGFGPAAIASSTLATFVVGMSVKLLLPVVALVVLVVEGERVAGIASAALAGVVVMAIGAGVFGFALRADSVARRLGRAAESTAYVLRRMVGRPVLLGWEDRVVGFRSRLSGLLSDRWRSLSAAAIASQLSVFFVMLVTMRLAGISEGEVGWAQALAVFASIRLATSVPIVPGNVGIAELGYIGGLVLAGGDTTEVVAAVLLFRFLTYFVQIPIGGATFLAWRRERAAAAMEPTPA